MTLGKVILNPSLTYKKIKCDDGIVRIFRTGSKKQIIKTSKGVITRPAYRLPIECLSCGWDLAQVRGWEISKAFAKKHSCGSTV